MNRGTLLSLESRMLLRQPSYLAALVCFTLLSLWGCFSGFSAMREREGLAAALEAEQRVSLRHALDIAVQADRGGITLGLFRDPRDISNFVRVVLNAPAVKPVKVAEVLSPVRGTDAPWYFNLNLGPLAKSMTTYEYTNPEARASGFDLNMLLVSFLPLFLIVAGFNLWTADREVHLDRLVRLSRSAAKYVYARRLTLHLAPFCCVYLALGVVALLLAHAPNITITARLTAVLLFTAIALLYFAFWWVCIFGVIRASRSSSVALVKLLLGWLVTVVLVPAMAQWHARTMYSQIPRSALLDEARRNSDVIAKSTGAVQQWYIARHPELQLTQDMLKHAPSGATALITAEANDELFTRQENAVSAVLMEQRSVVRIWSLLSPALLTQEALNDLAGSTIPRQMAFEQHVWGYVSELRGYYRPLLLRPTEESASAVEQYSSYPHFASGTGNAKP